MRRFEWLAAGPIPAAWDLRRLGWRLTERVRTAGDDELHPLLAMPHGLAFAEWLALTGAAPRRRARILMLGVGCSEERARLLRLGFGDALPPGAQLEEVEARALQRIERAGALPRHRQLGALRLDLLARDGMLAGRGLALHPREFALLWRLSDEPGTPVSAEVLLRDVWRLSFRPETNSLAVHISRLRAKLRVAGLDGLIETLPDGAYRLAQPGALPLPPASGKLALDGYLRLGEESGEAMHQQGAGTDHAV
ncbi:winged helix-turn-helix domain-containing protein [Novosphingobium sp.]|uniref:winged helix-turn-helix domain-containing protein n=1 Tax=Novosphingobium sp. TaxID=1874826 RepID=UPI0035B0C65B